MPYIGKGKRTAETEQQPQTCGELNYAITMKLIDYLDGMGRSYQTINDIVGALEGAKLEFYRRVVVPY